MTLLNALHVLLGAGLVAFGVLAHAAWTAIRRNAHRANNTFEHDWEWRPATAPARPTAARRPPPTPASRPAPAPISDTRPLNASAAARQNQRMRVVDVQGTEIPKKPMRSVPPVADPSLAMAKEVAAVLVANGYGKATATAAVNACPGSERTSVEKWAIAALRHCATA